MVRIPNPAQNIKAVVILAVLAIVSSCESEQKTETTEFNTHFEETQGAETATYLQTVDFYIRLAKAFPEINLQTMGETDSGYPLHIVTYNPDGDFNSTISVRTRPSF